jgi:hypothetical protein
MTDSDAVEVYSAANLLEAHQVKNVLQDEGIAAKVVGEALQTAAGELPIGWTTAPRLWVAQADYETARQIIDNWERERQTAKPIQSPPPWVCSHCGEEVPGEFDICWNCQSAKPG